MRPRRIIPPGLPLAALALLTAVGGSACRSAGAEPPAKATPYVPEPEDGPEDLGYFLVQLDKSLRRWSELKLHASDPKDLQVLQALEGNLTRRTRKRQDELIGVLESGPRMNREVAAMALGFTGDPAVLSPLLAALSDPDPGVVQKALLGIGVLGLEDTPLSKLEYLVLHHPDPWVRNNAAFALQRVVSAGAHSDALAVACREALIDEEPGVRAQAASVLGILRDPDAIPPLGNLLADDVNLVAAAAASALARIGHEHIEHKGEAARLLVGAFERAEGQQRPHLHRQLVYLSDRNLGEEVDEWREWAYRMP